MDFSRLTNPDAYKQALAGLLRRGEEVTDYIATAPEKAGQAIIEGHERNKALQAQAFANPNRPFQVTDANAMTQLGDRMLAGPLSVAPVGMIAYHGTPHLIKDKFDISKVGTGEGAQAFGHGMYFAENPAVAKQYANELGTKIDVNGNPLMDKGKIVGSTGNTELDDFLVANLGDVKATRKDLLQSIKEVRPTNPEGAKDYQKLLADLRKANVGTANTGNLYKVDIPDEQIPRMLDWDKPLSQQPKDVQEALAKFDPDMYSTKSSDYDANELGQHIYQRIIQDNVKKFGHGGNQKRASDDLNALGIKGIRYYDEGSRKAGGTSNFVVFDPTDVKLLERNNQPLTRKEILQEQLDKIAK